MQGAGVGAGTDDRRIGPGRVVASEFVQVFGFDLVLVHAWPHVGQGTFVRADGDLRGLAHGGDLRPALI